MWLIDWLFPKKTLERPSPKVRITPGQVHMVGDTLQVTGLPHCIIVAIAPTNSMEPVIDDGMFVVVDTGIPYGDLIPGDIIWFEAPGFAAIHRIIKVGQDKAGWYCETRGDNNGRADGVKVRPIYIKGVYRGQIT